jgi:hypothetical protein
VPRVFQIRSESVGGSSIDKVVLEMTHVAELSTYSRLRVAALATRADEASR